MRIMTDLAFHRVRRLVLVFAKEQSAAVAVKAELRLFGAERERCLPRIAVGIAMTGTASVRQGGMENPPLDDSLMAFTAVLVGGGASGAGVEE